MARPHFLQCGNELTVGPPSLRLRRGQIHQQSFCRSSTAVRYRHEIGRFLPPSLCPCSLLVGEKNLRLPIRSIWIDTKWHGEVLRTLDVVIDAVPFRHADVVDPRLALPARADAETCPSGVHKQRR